MYRILLLLFLFFSQFVFSQTNISGVVNVYREVKTVDTANGYVQLYNASDLTQYIGNSVMLIQMQGAIINETDGPNFGNINDIKQAGNFEIGKMCAQKGDTLLFVNKLQNFYNPNGHVQVVIIPKYINATVVAPLIAQPWDWVSHTGGIVAIEVSGTLTLNDNITADGAGFRGGGLINYTGNCSDVYPSNNYFYSVSGTSILGNILKAGAKKGEGIAEYIAGKEYGKGKQANGGGGGNNQNNGGGGGSNGSSGGNGGYKNGPNGCNAQNPGIGGLSLYSFGYSAIPKIFMGGGGGAGHEDNNVGTPGGRGGGIVYVKCGLLMSNNKKITANGGVPYNPTNADPYSAEGDGGGGGGGGGVILITTNTINGTLDLEANGGKGSDTNSPTGFCTGPGGGGGGGVILSPLPTNVNFFTNSGANGTVRNCNNVSNGASYGGAGFFSSPFPFPPLKDSAPRCKSVLPIKLINLFTGNLNSNKLYFTGEIFNPTQIDYCILQRSDEGINFTNIQTITNNTTTIYRFNDDQQIMTQYYRMLVITKDGSKKYSDIISFKGTGSKNISVTIYPNPVTNILNLQVNNLRSLIAHVKITDITGRINYTSWIRLRSGQQTYQVDVSKFAPGTYNLQFLSEDFVLNKIITRL
jgi:hypothetical protein